MKHYPRLNFSTSHPYLQFFGEAEADADFMARARLFAEAATVITHDRPGLAFDQRDEDVSLGRMLRDYMSLSRITCIRCDLWEQVIDRLRDYTGYAWTAEMRIKVCSLFLDTALRWRAVDASDRYLRWLACRDLCILPVAVHLCSTQFDQPDGDSQHKGDFVALPIRTAVLTLGHIRSQLDNPLKVSEAEREEEIRKRSEADTKAASVLSLHLNALGSIDPETSSIPLRRLILHHALSFQTPKHRREMVESALHDSITRIQSFLI